MSREHDPFDTEAQEEADREKREADKLLSDLEAEDVRWLLAHKQGRRLMWGLLERAGVFRTSFTGTSTTYFLEGKRDIGLRYIDLMTTHCPERFTELLKEHKRNEHQRKQRARPN